MQENRSQWIDILKGIGILLIVIGHIINGPIRDFLYLFHVPIFFFLSGYLFNGVVDIKLYVLKKIKRLLIPYFVFLFTFTAILIFKELLLNRPENTFTLIQSAFLGGAYLTGWLSVFWFITSLFFTQIIYAFLCKYDKKIIYSLMFFSLFLAYFTSVYVPDFFNVWSFNTVFYALPIYFLGHVSASFKFDYLFKISLTLVLCLLPIYLLHPNYFYIDIKAIKYGVPIIALLLSLALVVITFYVSKKIQYFSFLANPIAYLGGMSMTIMYMHQPIQITLKHLLSIDKTFILVFLAVFFSVVTHQLLKTNSFTSRLILGSK